MASDYPTLPGRGREKQAKLIQDALGLNETIPMTFSNFENTENAQATVSIGGKGKTAPSGAGGRIGGEA